MYFCRFPLIITSIRKSCRAFSIRSLSDTWKSFSVLYASVTVLGSVSWFLLWPEIPSRKDALRCGLSIVIDLMIGGIIVKMADGKADFFRLSFSHSLFRSVWQIASGHLPWCRYLFLQCSWSVRFRMPHRPNWWWMSCRRWGDVPCAVSFHQEREILDVVIHIAAHDIEYRPTVEFGLFACRDVQFSADFKQILICSLHPDSWQQVSVYVSSLRLSYRNAPSGSDVFPQFEWVGKASS